MDDARNQAGSNNNSSPLNNRRKENRENFIQDYAQRKIKRFLVRQVASKAPLMIGLGGFFFIILMFFFFDGGTGGALNFSPTPDELPPAAGAPTRPPIQGFTLTLEGPTSVDNGQLIQYRISYNYDEATAVVPLESITVYFDLPQNASFESATGNPSNSSGTVSWPLDDTVNQTTLTLTLRPTRDDVLFVVKAYARTSATVGPGGGGSSQNSCTQPHEGTGYCAYENLLPYFGNDPQAALEASLVCQIESSSNPFAKNLVCPDYSIGLFQINLVAHCAGAYNNLNCNSLNSASARSVCEERFLDPIENITYAYDFYNSPVPAGVGWNANKWSSWPKAESILRSCGSI